MKKRQDQHILRFGLKWAVYGEGNSRKTLITDQWTYALRRAKEIVRRKRSRVVIYDLYGQRRDDVKYPFHPNVDSDW